MIKFYFLELIAQKVQNGKLPNCPWKYTPFFLFVSTLGNVFRVVTTNLLHSLWTWKVFFHDNLFWTGPKKWLRDVLRRIISGFTFKFDLNSTTFFEFNKNIAFKSHHVIFVSMDNLLWNLFYCKEIQHFNALRN